MRWCCHRKTGAGRTARETTAYRTQADARRGAVPEMTNDYIGPARLETFTVVYGRDKHRPICTVIAEDAGWPPPHGARAATDAASLAPLTELDSHRWDTRRRFPRCDEL